MYPRLWKYGLNTVSPKCFNGTETVILIYPSWNMFVYWLLFLAQLEMVRLLAIIFSPAGDWFVYWLLFSVPFILGVFIGGYFNSGYVSVRLLAVIFNPFESEASMSTGYFDRISL